MIKTTTLNRTLHMSHIAGAALLLGACSSNDASTIATQEDYEQIAQSLAGNASVTPCNVTTSLQGVLGPLCAVTSRVTSASGGQVSRPRRVTA